MKKLLLKILVAFVIITVVVGFFIGDLVSKESDQMWERVKEKPSLVTAEDIEADDTSVEKINIVPAMEDDKNEQVLRIETLSLGEKLVSFIPEDNIAGSASLNVVAEMFNRPKSVKPHQNDCGVQDASIVNFGNIEFKKVRAEYYIYNITLAGSKFELKTPRLLINKDTKLEDFKTAYADKAAVLALNNPNEAVVSEVEVVEPKNKKGKAKPKEAKLTELSFLTTGSSEKKWIVSFNTKGVIQSIKMDDASCKPEPEVAPVEDKVSAEVVGVSEASGL